MNDEMNTRLKVNTTTKVLVVDDNPANLDILVRFLEPAGHNLAVADNGEKAIKVADHFLPDLILLDVMMPGIDGFDTCRRLKLKPATMDIPVIFVTAKKDTESIVNGFTVGGVDYISKPFRKEEVMARVNTHIQMRKLIMSQTDLITELREAMGKIKTLKGLLPICSGCKKIRDDKGYWHHVEAYIADHSEADFSHGMCRECAKKLYPDLDYNE